MDEESEFKKWLALDKSSKILNTSQHEHSNHGWGWRNPPVATIKAG